MQVGTNSTIYRMLSTIRQLESDTAQTQTRLATNKRINRASDDPAGLIALNTMNSQLMAVNVSLGNNQRSQSMLNVADSTLTEVNTLTSQIQELVLKAQDSTLSVAEKAAYQAQIDQSVDSIDTLLNSAEFAGKKIFNGENRINAYTATPASVKDIRVYSRDPNNTTNLTLSVGVTAAATRGSATTTVNVAAATTLSAATTIQVTGKLGTATINMAAGTTGTNVLAAIVAQKQVTGVSAIAVGNNLHMMSTSTGSDAFVAVSTLAGGTVWTQGVQIAKTAGVDAKVTVNGAQANAQGTEVFYNGGGVSLSFNLANDAVANHTITVVSSGGATFQLGTTNSTRTSLGLANLTTAELGRSDIGYLQQLKSGGSNALNVTNNKALEISKYASNQVAVAAGRIGSFNKYQIGSSINAMEAAQEGMTAARDQIEKTDYSAESAKLQQQQILMQAAVSMLSLANSSQQNVLSLLQ